MVQHYAKGSIYWHPAFGPITVRGQARDLMVCWSRALETLGYPIHDTELTKDEQQASKRTLFEVGGIYETTTGAAAITGEIWKRYEQLGLETGGLGVPTTFTKTVSDNLGRFATFKNGVIYHHPQSARSEGSRAYAVFNSLVPRWQAAGGATGVLGYPSENQTDKGGSSWVRFQNGIITYSRATGVHYAHGKIAAAYLEPLATTPDVGPEGALGLLESDQAQNSFGSSFVQTEEGGIVEGASTGARKLSRAAYAELRRVDPKLLTPRNGETAAQVEAERAKLGLGLPKADVGFADLSAKDTSSSASANMPDVSAGSRFQLGLMFLKPNGDAFSVTRPFYQRYVQNQDCLLEPIGNATDGVISYEGHHDGSSVTTGVDVPVRIQKFQGGKIIIENGVSRAEGCQ